MKKIFFVTVLVLTMLLPLQANAKDKTEVPEELVNLAKEDETVLRNHYASLKDFNGYPFDDAEDAKGIVVTKFFELKSFGDNYYFEDKWGTAGRLSDFGAEVENSEKMYICLMENSKTNNGLEVKYTNDDGNYRMFAFGTNSKYVSATYKFLIEICNEYGLKIKDGIYMDQLYYCFVLEGDSVEYIVPISQKEAPKSKNDLVILDITTFKNFVLERNTKQRAAQAASTDGYVYGLTENAADTFAGRQDLVGQLSLAAKSNLGNTASSKMIVLLLGVLSFAMIIALVTFVSRKKIKFSK